MTTDTTGYVPVLLQTFRNTVRELPFDVYIRLGDGHFAHVFSKSTGLDYRRLAQYFMKGVTELFIKEEDSHLLEDYRARSFDAILSDSSTSSEKRMGVLLNLTEQNISEVFQQVAVSEETAKQTKKLVKAYVEQLSSNPKSLILLLRLVSHGDYLYYHSISVAIFSLFLGKASGQFNQRTLEILGMGGLLHDIGQTLLPRELVDSKLEYNSAQWKQMRDHPRLGLQMLEKAPNVSDEVRYIVYQHHEEQSGQGYPNGLNAKAIYYPAKVVAVADAFSALISIRPYRPAYSADQAVHILQSEMSKYDRDIVRLLAQIFMKAKPAQDAA